MRRYPLSAVLATAVILAAGLLGSAPTRALEPPPEAAAAGPVAALARQPAWVTPGDAAVLEFRIPEPVGELEIQVSTHRAATSRSALTRSLSGGSLGAVEGRLSVPVAALPVDAEGDRLLQIGIQGPETPPDDLHIVPGRTGVYPLDVVVRRPGAGAAVTRFVTPLVVVAPGLIPLTLAWVWRFDATPAYLPDGRMRPSAVRALAPGGRLARMAAAASAADGLRLTLAPTPETVEGWAEMARNTLRRDAGVSPTSPLSQFRTAADQSAHQVLGAPYVAADLPGLVAAGLTDEVDRQFARGGQALRAALDTSPPPARTLLAGALDPDALAQLRRYGTQRLVVSPAELKPFPQRLTPGRPFLLAAKGRPVDAAVSDPDLAAYLTGDDPPALQAARFLAALSMVAFEAPRDQRGVVVVMPPDWSPSGALLSTVLAGLKEHPAILSATLNEYFAGIPAEMADGQPLTRVLADPEEAARIEPKSIESARARVTSLAQVVGQDQPRALAADRALLTGQAEELAREKRASGKPSGTAYVNAARAMVTDMTRRVKGPDGQRVTLTARRARIPISLLNANPEPLQVRVRLESDQLRFPGGADRILTLPPQNTTERFAVETRASGAFPLVITVTSPDGALVVSRSEVIIRSTVVSGAGALLTAGAGVFLLVWWGNDLRRSRRRLRPVAGNPSE